MNNVKSKIWTPSEILDNPEMADFHEAALFLHNNNGKILFPRKFLIGVKSMIAQRVPEMYKNDPQMPITEVVSAILSGLDKRTDSDMILKITKWIVEEWQSVSSSKVIQKKILQAA
jgi:hypothetical protein